VWYYGCMEFIKEYLGSKKNLVIILTLSLVSFAISYAIQVLVFYVNPGLYLSAWLAIAILGGLIIWLNNLILRILVFLIGIGLTAVGFLISSFVCFDGCPRYLGLLLISFFLGLFLFSLVLLARLFIVNKS